MNEKLVHWFSQKLMKMHISNIMSSWDANSITSPFAEARFLSSQDTFHYFTFQKIEKPKKPCILTDDWTWKLIGAYFPLKTN